MSGVFKPIRQAKPDVPGHGYGFSTNLGTYPDWVTYVYDTIEGAETAAQMAQGMGDGTSGWPIFIYPYFDGVRGKGAARSVCETDGSVQCSY